MTDNNTSGASREMPRYQCHKQVWALKIASISGATVTPADEGYGPFDVLPELYLRYTPRAGDYYVVYEDSYAAFSPAKAFEDGYTRLSALTEADAAADLAGTPRPDHPSAGENSGPVSA